MAGFFESIAARGGRTPLLAAWVIEGEAAGARALFAREGSRWAGICREGGFPDACLAEIEASGRPGILSVGHSRLFLEELSPGRKLVICGAGHVSMPVIKIAAMLNYEVTAIDDRAEFVEKARAAGAHHVICRPFGEALEETVGDPSTAFVIMTREHAHDVDCLRRILQKPRAYVGMMGSRSRTEHIRQQLLEEGFDDEAVGNAHMPIGLPIGSRTPEEIAVSVMAEVVSVMNASDDGEGFPPGMLKELTAPGGEMVLSMIVEKRGEAPRRPGTKMLVRRDGRFTGTVGGGIAEVMILKAAGDMLREGCRQSRLVDIALEKGGMACGGEIAVFLLPLNTEVQL